ncbi:MAG TPA: hypothetical protein VIL13_03725 [Longimicrobiales bacterium]
MRGDRLGIRWTIGDVSPFGFEALRLSIWGAWKLFGPSAAYVVCVNTVPVDRARAWTGDIPPGVRWHRSTRAQIPGFLRTRIDPGMAEGVGWKFAPIRLFPDRYELSLDNDCILWETPAAIREWLERGDPELCVLAQDVATCHGQFADIAGPEPRNAGIRGLPPGFSLEAVLREILAGRTGTLCVEGDEQGLQAAAVAYARPPLLVTVEEVTICSPFPPHLPHLGRCGAHFVGLNAKRLPWELDGRNGADHIREHWLRHRDTLYEKVGISPQPEARSA